MTDTLLYTILILCGLGVISALILYVVAQKFKVHEDPRLGTIESMLPGANCGGCGFAGCKGLATELVSQEDISTLYCPVGGAPTMNAIAEFLGKKITPSEPKTAVVRCAGSCAKRPRTNRYDGAKSCAIEATLYSGETACSYGCLGKGDCVATCNFEAIHLDSETGLPVVDSEKCTACGACVKACPKGIIELRKKGPNGRRIFVSCVNKEKGAIARRACSAACIGCGKCVKTCPFEAITLENNLAYIDFNKCRLCRKCVSVCPTSAIWEVNFPSRQVDLAVDTTPEIPSCQAIPASGKLTSEEKQTATVKSSPAESSSV